VVGLSNLTRDVRLISYLPREKGCLLSILNITLDDVGDFKQFVILVYCLAQFWAHSRDLYSLHVCQVVIMGPTVWLRKMKDGDFGRQGDLTGVDYE
jgi:hypothetical protein